MRFSYSEEEARKEPNEGPIGKALASLRTSLLKEDLKNEYESHGGVDGWRLILQFSCTLLQSSQSRHCPPKSGQAAARDCGSRTLESRKEVCLQIIWGLNADNAPH
jgi:hypothetical protein